MDGLQEQKSRKNLPKRQSLLIREEIDALINRYQKAEETKAGDLADLKQDFKEIASMLKSYLAKPKKHDNEIYKVYREILFII